MGLIQAAIGAIGGALADQWLDFYSIPSGIEPTAAIFPAVQQGRNAGRGSDTKASQGIITNGSRIIVPEGYALLTFESGAITGLAAQAGGYIWNSDDVNSGSIFSGGLGDAVKSTWERFKFGGRPGSQQQALFVSIKELPDNKFGTQSTIYWDDAYLGAQAGALTRGTYTLKIVDPILFAKNFVPASYLQGGEVFDFTDIDNPAATQLFNEVVGSLAQAFSLYTNDPAKGRITKLQQDSVGFAQTLSQVVEQNYQWKSNRGLEIVSTAILSIEYDQTTQALLTKVQQADALSGSRGNANLQASVAQGIQSAGENGGAGGLFGIGVAAGNLGLGGLQQPTAAAGNPAFPGGAAAAAAPAAAPTAAPEAPAGDDPVARLTQLKQLLDQGLITQADYDAAKAKALGL